MQGKPSSPLCQVWVHVSLRVAKQQMSGIPAWTPLLSKWKQRYGTGHAENKGEKRNNKNEKNMKYAVFQMGKEQREERVSSTAYMLCWYASGMEEEEGYWKDKREEGELKNPGESDQFCIGKV